jgi:hypothetical protein
MPTSHVTDGSGNPVGSSIINGQRALNVDVLNSIPLSGSVTANAGTNLNTSALALESGGNLASVASVEGTQSDVSVVGDNNGTISAKLRGLSKILNSVWSSANNWLQVSVQNASLSVNVNETVIQSVAGSISSNTAIVAAVTGFRIKVVAYSLTTSYSAGSINPIFTDGNAGTTIWSVLLQAISGAISGVNLAIGHPYWLFGTTAGNALYLNPNGQTVYYSISYFSTDAT